MSMRYPKGKRHLIFAFLPCAAFAIFLAVDSSGSGSSAPWITEGSPGIATYAVLLVGGGLVGHVLGTLTGRRLSLRHADSAKLSKPPKKKPVWRYREMSRREKRRLAASLSLSLSVTCAPLSIYSLYSQPEGKAALVLWVLMGAGTLGTLTGFVGMLVQIRPSRTVMQIVEDRLTAEREQWKIQLTALREADALELERWKGEAGMEIYAEVIRQLDQGMITCSKCAELGAARHVAPEKEARVPDARGGEEANKPCHCGGPTSVPVIYFPPRFQQKRAAS